MFFNTVLKQADDEGKRKIVFWPCGTWCYCDEEDVETFMRAVGLSDDFAFMFVSEELAEDEVDAAITSYFNRR